MNSLLKQVKENNEDYEWYPTTNEIIESLYKDLIIQVNHFSMLDIGAGNGKIFETLEKINERELKNKDTYDYTIKNNIERFSIKKYAIEKSVSLINSMNKDIYLVGTDFYEQSLLDKKVDVIFCNPPYSQFENWTIKILKEANSKVVYMVIPKRWENNKEVQNILKVRDYSYTILGEYSFEDSEDRKARAYVNLIRFDHEAKINDRYYSKTNDPFDSWFEDNFKINADKSIKRDYETEKEHKDTINNNLIEKENLISEIATLYNNELDSIYNNYKALESLDYQLFKELNINIKNIKEGLKLKIEGLKNLYWKIVFDRLTAITDRLTSKSRDKMMKKLFEQTSIDITESNIYSLLIWVIKNANSYFDSQLLEVYYDLADKENIRNYKSNKKFVADDWRYIRSEMSHFSLDYRIITSSYGAFSQSYTYNTINGICETSYHKLNDILTVAKNLGFNIPSYALNVEWKPGKRVEIYYNESSETKLFCDIKIYKNNNCHIRFTPDFMKKLNIEAGRLNGWLKTPQDVVNEINDISIEEAEKMFGSNNTLKIEKSNARLLLN